MLLCPTVITHGLVRQALFPNGAIRFEHVLVYEFLSQFSLGFVCELVGLLISFSFLFFVGSFTLYVHS